MGDGCKPWQWCGWKQSSEAGQWLRVSAWIKFIGSVPTATRKNLGFKIHGAHYQNWVRNAVADEWTWASIVAPARPGHDRDYILLIFDCIDKPQIVRFAGLELEVFTAKPKEREM